MATVPLIPQQTEAVFQALALTWKLALTKDPNDPNNQFFGVRIAWQTQGQPGGDPSQDLVYIRAIEDDEEYNRVRDESFNKANQSKTVTYQRTWRVFWVVYGPNSYDNTRIIRSALLDDEKTKNMLSSVGLYIVPNPEAPLRTPEPAPGNLWKERVDFSCQFNEQVTEIRTLPSVLITNIIIENQTGYTVDPEVDATPLPDGSFGSGPFGSGPFGE